MPLSLQNIVKVKKIAYTTRLEILQLGSKESDKHWYIASPCSMLLEFVFGSNSRKSDTTETENMVRKGQLYMCVCVCACYEILLISSIVLSKDGKSWQVEHNNIQQEGDRMMA